MYDVSYLSYMYKTQVISSEMIEARKVMLVRENAVLSHREISTKNYFTKSHVGTQP